MCKKAEILKQQLIKLTPLNQTITQVARILHVKFPNYNIIHKTHNTDSAQDDASKTGQIESRAY